MKKIPFEALTGVVSPDSLILNATDYGVLPSLGNVSTAIQSFLALCNSQKRVAYFPAGDYNLGSLITSLVHRVDLLGDGEDLTRFIFNAASGGTSGITLDNSTLNTDQRTIHVTGIGFLRATTAGSGIAINFIGSPIEGGELRRSIIINKCRFSGLTPTYGWQYGIKLTKALSFIITENYFSGAVGVFDSAPSTVMASAVYFGDGTNIGDISNNIFDWVYSAVKAFDSLPSDSSNFSEGINFHHNTVRATMLGFDVEVKGQAYWITDNHFDVVLGAVKLGFENIIGENNSKISGNFILRAGAASWGTSGSPKEFCAIDCNTNFVVITDNDIPIPGDIPSDGSQTIARWTNSIGVRIGSLTDANKQGRAMVSNNIFSGLSKFVHLRTSARRCRVTNNSGEDFSNVNTISYINDGGISNIIKDNNFTKESGNIVTVNDGADAREVYAEAIITANMNNAAGNTADTVFGNLITAVKNIGGALNLVSAIFTAPIAGVYQLTGFLSFTGQTNSQLGVLRYTSSINADRNINFYPAAGGVSWSIEIYMSAGETIYPHLLISTGTQTVNVLGTKNQSLFTYRIVRPD